MALCGRKTDLRTGPADDRVERRALTGEGKYLSRDAAWRRRTFQELGCFVPARPRVHGTVSQRLVGEESKQSVLEDRPAGAPTELVEAAILTLQPSLLGGCCPGPHWTIPPLVGVQPRTVGFEEQAAVVIIGSVLGNHHDLRSAVTAVLGAVIVRDNSDLLDGLLVRGDHSGATPGQTVHFDTVDLVTVRDVPSSIRVDLYLVLRLENAACGAGSSRSRAAGQVLAAASGTPGAIAKNAGGEAQQLKGIPAERRQRLDLSARQRSRYLRAFRVQQRRDGLCDGERFRYLTELQ